jgi:serine/threonine-protein kinase
LLVPPKSPYLFTQKWNPTGETGGLDDTLDSATLANPGSNAGAVVRVTADSDTLPHDATVGVEVACAATIAASTAAPFAAPTAGTSAQSLGLPPQGPASASSRSTVLPRLHVVGDVPTLIHEGRVRYEEGRVLGAGGVGEVVEAQDNDICRPVAIKRMLPHVQSPAALVRFVDEIRTVGQLEHPNIVPIHDVGIDQAGQLFFVMKYVQGETLESILDKLRAGDGQYHRLYTFERRAKLFVGVLEAMQYAHARGLLHRDIKPANIMVGPYGEVMVMDWGIAKHVGSDEETLSDRNALPDESSGSGRMAGTAVGTIIGTPAYMSPEQARGEVNRLDERSDIYSLCVLFHELLCLEHYLASRSDLHSILAGVLNDTPRHPSFVVSSRQSRVPSDLGWIVMDGLAKDPAKRYTSVGEMLARLQGRLDGDIKVQCPATFTKRMTHKWMHFVDNHPYALIAGMGVVAISLLMGIALGGWALWHAIA